MIIDGFGLAASSEGNAISIANMPNWDNIINTYPHTKLNASGNAVGLPNGVMGNSEVGHLTIGTGRIVYQSLELINQSCEANTIKENSDLLKLVSHVSERRSNFHLMGLLSDGGVHSHQNHLYHLLDILSPLLLQTQIYLHLFMDGRDTPPDSGVDYLQQLIDKITPMKNVAIATIVGRYYVMDRDKKWDRTRIAFDLLTKGLGEATQTPIELIQARYLNGETDEFLRPIIVNSEGIMKSGDGVLFFNFRPDRARQIMMALNGMQTDEFEKYPDLECLTMTSYDDKWKFPVLFKSPNLSDSLGELVSKAGYRQVHIAETEKYAHVTYFLNGGYEAPFGLEERILIPSLKVATYDLQPEMSTQGIIDATINELENKTAKLIVLNIASPDMVGHTGNLNATVHALEYFDTYLGKLLTKSKEMGYTMVITSDHGNCEHMIENGKIHTAHTTNLVPFVITEQLELFEEGGLSDVAPTILELLNIPVSNLMSGTTLIRN